MILFLSLNLNFSLIDETLQKANHVNSNQQYIYIQIHSIYFIIKSIFLINFKQLKYDDENFKF